MSAEPARSLQQVMDQLDHNQRSAIDATIARLAEVPQPTPSVGREELGTLPVGATPHQAAKDLVAKYGRPTPMVERVPEREPQP